MRTHAGLLSSSLLALVGACDPGSTLGEDIGELTCSAHLLITGTFTVADPQPAAIAGCWPIGTWQFTTSVESNDCAGDPVLAPQYEFLVARDLTSEDPDFNWDYTYTTDPANPNLELKVSSGGGGLCEGALRIYSADGKTIWNLHPALQADGTLNGQGDYEVWTTNQIPDLSQQ